MAGAAPAPAFAIGAVPVIIPVDPHQLPFDIGRDRRTTGIDRDHVESALAITFCAAFELRLQAEIERRRTVGNADIIGDSPAAGFDGGDDGPDAQRLGGIGTDLARTDGQGRGTGTIGHRARQILGTVAERFVMPAEAEPGIVGEGTRVGLDPQTPLDRQSCTRSAVEEADIGGDFTLAAKKDRRLVIGVEFQGDALRNEILDREPGRADIAIPVHRRDNAPFAARGGHRQMIVPEDRSGLRQALKA